MVSGRKACDMLKVFYKISSLFVKGVMFVNRNYVTNDDVAYAKNI